MEIIYQDRDIIVCIKPAGVLSTDEPGGLPELVRRALGDENANVRTVHRLDRVVSGLMVLARSKKAAAELSRQIREDRFEKEYMAVVHGELPPTGELRDLLRRDRQERKTYIVDTPGKDVQEAILSYQCLGAAQGLSRVQIRLQTGRTHQIRAQFSGRGYPLVGDQKYGLQEPCNIALWSWRLCFDHPWTGQPMEFTAQPPRDYPWTVC